MSVPGSGFGRKLTDDRPLFCALQLSVKTTDDIHFKVLKVSDDPGFHIVNS